MAISTETQLAEVIERLKAVGTDVADVELKSGREGFPESARTMSAFSNTHGGTIVYGIRENTFHPVRDLDVKAIQNGCAQAAREQLEPPIMADIRVLPFEGSSVVVANIPEASPRQKPVYVRREGRQRGSYLRTGDGDHALTLYEVDRLVENERRHATHDMALVHDAILDDLDAAALEQWIRRIRLHAFGRVQTLSDEELMLNRRVIAWDDEGVLRPTMAGLLALGTYPQKFFPRIRVTFASYPSPIKADATATQRYLDRLEIDGNIPEMVVATVAAISRNIRHGAVIEGALRHDVTDYPLVAVREAVANALLHRDYSPEGTASPVLVELYPNRLEITNPGGLFGSLTVHDLLVGAFPVARNAALSNILGDVAYSSPEDEGNVVENLGTGMRIILEELERSGMRPPLMENSLDWFSITFFRRTDENPDRRAYVMDDRRNAVLQSVRKMGEPSARDLSQALGVSLQTVRKYLNELLESGEIVPIGKPHSPNRRYRAS